MQAISGVEIIITSLLCAGVGVVLVWWGLRAYRKGNKAIGVIALIIGAISVGVMAWGLIRMLQ